MPSESSDNNFLLWKLIHSSAVLDISKSTNKPQYWLCFVFRGSEKDDLKMFLPHGCCKLLYCRLIENLKIFTFYYKRKKKELETGKFSTSVF